MSDKSIYREEWGSGGLAFPEGMQSPGEAQFQERKHLAQRKIKTKKFGTLTHEQFQQYLTESQKSRVVHSDGFLSLSHVGCDPAYVCPSCNFEGLFRADKCARCSSPIEKGN